MIALAETWTDVQVPEAEYRRLLGYPRDYVMEGRARELAEGAREWYASHGRPWLYAREAQSISVEGDFVVIEGEGFRSPRLARTLSQGAAHGAVLVAAGAGPEVEDEARRLWLEEKPDEYFFLEVYGPERGRHARSAVGVAALPFGFCVEIEAEVEIEA